MKKMIALVGTIGLATMGCVSNPQQTTNQTDHTEITIGGDRDEHGCLTSAGESWSQVQGRCIQVFKVGEALLPANPTEGEAVLAAYIVRGDDDSRVELFAVDLPTSLVLDHAGDGIYRSEGYLYNATNKQLLVQEQLAYIGK